MDTRTDCTGCRLVAGILLYCAVLPTVASAPQDQASLRTETIFSVHAHANVSVIQLHVNCNAVQVESPDGTRERPFLSLASAVQTAQHLSLTPWIIEVKVLIAKGVCYLKRPLLVTGGVQHGARVTIVGEGVRSVLSGGKKVTGWTAVTWPGAPHNTVFAANVSSWPVEIKSLRHADKAIPRSRWPKLVGDGSTTPNWLFATDWSTHPADTSDGARHLHAIGIDPHVLPAGTSAEDLLGAYAHVLGCIENDVNSQLTKVVGIGGSSKHPTLDIFFRNSFNVNQRWYLENVRFALQPGSFFHDASAGLLYYWPGHTHTHTHAHTHVRAHTNFERNSQRTHRYCWAISSLLMWSRR